MNRTVVVVAPLDVWGVGGVMPRCA